MGADDELRDGEAEAGTFSCDSAACGAGAGLLDAEKPVENAGLSGSRDAAALVLHVEFAGTGDFPETDVDGGAGRGVLNGVVEQDDDHLAEEFGVGGDLGFGELSDPEANLLRAGEDAAGMNGFEHEFIQAAERALQLEATGVGPGEGEEIADEAGESFQLAPDGAEGFAVLFAGTGAIEGDLGGEQTDGEGCAEFVRRVGHELLFLLKGAVETTEEAIEDGSEVA